jgi:RimJ/RimL family protein N-acetyltransferase
MAWPTHTSLDDTDTFLWMSDGMWDEFGCGPMLIIDRESKAVMGSAGLMFGEANHVGVGYILAEEFHGRGLATEALRQSVEIARGKGIKQLTVCIHPATIASRHVAKKCGFVLDAEKPAGHFVFPQIDPDTEDYTVNYILQL